jgi:hypothetical protein
MRLQAHPHLGTLFPWHYFTPLVRADLDKLIEGLEPSQLYRRP